MFLSSVLDFIFPPKCLACGEFHQDSLCSSCEMTWLTLPDSLCSRCSRPFMDDSPLSGEHLCADCLLHPPHFQKIYAAGLYEGLIHDFVVRLKYRREENLAYFLGSRMAAALNEDLSYDMILPVPMSRKRLRQRSYNQAVLLGRVVSKIKNIPLDVSWLKKNQETESQVNLSGEERRKNLKNVFGLSPKHAIKDKNILIVDDVVTTGTTLNEVAKVLKKAGARTVEALVLARSI